MAKHLSAQRLKTAVMRLGGSQAKPVFLDFLLIKRALKLDPTHRAHLSVTNTHWKQSCAEIMACFAEDFANPTILDPGAAELKLINVFGTADHSDHGYRTTKYISNGTGSNVVTGRWDAILHTHSKNPTVVTLDEGYLPHIQALSLKKRGKKPAIIDLAMWWFRFRDIEPHLADSNQGIANNLVSEVRNALGITDNEITNLFDVSESEDII